MTENKNNFLEMSVVKDLIQNIEQIEQSCRGAVGEEIVKERVKQLAYAKLLCNIYGKETSYLIKAYSQLGIAYLDIEYYEQAKEHLVTAFKLNENINEDVMISSKEYQIKILISLSKCYLEQDNTTSALAICEKSLKMNQALLGETHLSNADIYYVLAKINAKTKNYKAAIDNLSKMFEIYEKVYGFDSEKTAKICMELGQIYELSDNINDSIDYYQNSYKIWEKVIKDDNYEVLFTLAIKISELLVKGENYNDAYEILKRTESRFGVWLIDKNKQRINYKKLLIKYSQENQDLINYLNELLDLEKIIVEINGEYDKNLAKTCVSIATTYYQLGKAEESQEYFEKAERILTIFGDTQIVKEIQQKKEQLLNSN